MQQGLSDRAIARSGLMGRHKVADVRGRPAPKTGLYSSGATLPDEATLKAFFARKITAPLLAPHRALRITERELQAG